MARLAIGLNDAAIVVADGGGVIAVEPGCAALCDGGLATGREALGVSRLRPLDFRDRFWEELSVDPLATPWPGVGSTADLAHAQLDALWQRVRDGVDEVLLAVPGRFDRERLALLLGIANACEMPVRGLVDAALACGGHARTDSAAVHVEAHQHALGLTHLRRTDTEWIAERWEPIADIGLAELYERWAVRIASAFVEQTRFDPRVSGASEQAFFDALPGWLAPLARARTTSVEFEWTGVKRTVQVARDALLDATPELLDTIVAAVARSRAASAGCAVRVGPVLASLPGVSQRLAELDGPSPVVLPVGAAATGALRCADAFRSPPDAIALVNALPLAAAGDGGEVGA